MIHRQNTASKLLSADSLFFFFFPPDLEDARRITVAADHTHPDTRGIPQFLTEEGFVTTKTPSTLRVLKLRIPSQGCSRSSTASQLEFGTVAVLTDRRHCHCLDDTRDSKITALCAVIANQPEDDRGKFDMVSLAVFASSDDSNVARFLMDFGTRGSGMFSLPGVEIIELQSVVSSMRVAKALAARPTDGSSPSFMDEIMSGGVPPQPQLWHGGRAVHVYISLTPC